MKDDIASANIALERYKKHLVLVRDQDEQPMYIFQPCIHTYIYIYTYTILEDLQFIAFALALC